MGKRMGDRIAALRLRMSRERFMFEELVKRDFKKKYKRTILGMGWSILNPLLTLLVMRLVFTQFFGRTVNHYTIYMFAGNLMFSYFRESTNGGMNALTGNASIFTKVNVPKYLFVLSKNVSSIINFLLTLVVFFLFVWIDHVQLHWAALGMIYPIVMITLMNIGIGMILSALNVFFRDIQYLYDIFTMLLMYLSAIFYTVDSYPEQVQRLFLMNPVYCCIKYVRVVVLDGLLPSPAFHLLILGYTVLFLGIGLLIYKKQNTKFLYYV